MKFQDATVQEIDAIMQEAWKAFLVYRDTLPKQRADLMRAIARELEAAGDGLIQTAMRETNLPETRLRNERARTMFQLTSYADACEAGHWLEARIDTAIPEKSEPDVRKLQVAVGPVVVFGASNFPFAYSTAGGDTASALAAGCPVVVKAHPAHAETSEMVAQAIARAVSAAGLPKGVFGHVHGAGFETGKTLVTHTHTRAVGFTGSFAGGKALFDWANQRPVPIPVFAEMGSINPVFLLPGKLKTSARELAAQLAGSITLGTGSVLYESGAHPGRSREKTWIFLSRNWRSASKKRLRGPCCIPELPKRMRRNASTALTQANVNTVAVAAAEPQVNQGVPTVASATAEAFFNNPVLHQEVFGPYSLVVQCKNMDELEKAARHLEGQLTVSLMATDKDLSEHGSLLAAAQDICGRLILNGVPTGVRVALAMQHGGPFPATTDSRYGAVGADGIKRWVRPLCYQSWSDAALPEALKNGNPLGIWRIVNNQLTKAAI